MRLILDVTDDSETRAAAFTAFDGFGRPEYWKVGFGWTATCRGRQFWLKRTKTGFAIKQLDSDSSSSQPEKSK